MHVSLVAVLTACEIEKFFPQKGYSVVCYKNFLGRNLIIEPPLRTYMPLEQAWQILKSYPEHMDYEGRGNTCHACGRTCDCPATDWISQLHPDKQHDIRQIKTRGGLTPQGGAGIIALRENDGGYGTEYGSGPNGEVTEEDLVASGRRAMVDRINDVDKRPDKE